jgi:hypothetical protein
LIMDTQFYLDGKLFFYDRNKLSAKINTIILNMSQLFAFPQNP